MDLTRELNQSGVTICRVAHNPEYASQAKRKVHLFDGRVIEDVSA
jgi:putative ABC transport system ATP-binding protein